MEADHDRFCKMCWYHSWHVPEMRTRPYVKNAQVYNQYYGPQAPGVTKYRFYNEDLDKLKIHIGTFYYDDFMYYSRHG